PLRRSAYIRKRLTLRLAMSAIVSMVTAVDISGLGPDISDFWPRSFFAPGSGFRSRTSTSVLFLARSLMRGFFLCLVTCRLLARVGGPSLRPRSRKYAAQPSVD